MPSLTLQRRAVSLVAWLVVAGLLIRIAMADGTFKGLGNPVPPEALVEIVVGLALLAAALALVAGFAIRAQWSQPLSLAAGVLAVPYGLSLLVASHESGALLSIAALVALGASLIRLP